MKKAANKAEKQHMARVAALGCVVCRNLSLGLTPAELHHPREKAGAGQRASHFDVIPLCALHHRTGGYGVALHAGQKEFERNYGVEADLLAQTKSYVEVFFA